MTIREAIEQVDRLKPNQYGEQDKIAWLSKLDGRLYRETVQTHETAAADFQGYPETVDLETELLAAWPYDELYRWYLEMMIDDADGETVLYNNSAAKFNTTLAAWQAWYNRENMPVQRVTRFAT